MTTLPKAISQEFEFQVETICRAKLDVMQLADILKEGFAQYGIVVTRIGYGEKPRG